MQTIVSSQKSLFINGETRNASKPLAQTNHTAAGETEPVKQAVLKVTSKQNIADAEAMFARANSYANVSAKVQKSLAAYEALEISQKQDALSKLMGVDLYA